MTIIGILGNKQVGKDTLADYFVSKYNFTKYNFADPIKEICKILFNLNEEQLYGNDKEIVDTRWGMSPRTIIQRFGTEFGHYKLNSIYPELKTKIKPKEIWIKLFDIFLENNKDKDIIIADVRFIHEINYLINRCALIIKIERDTHLNDSHISENEINKIDKKYIEQVFKNNDSKEELYKKCDNFYGILKNSNIDVPF